MAVVNGTTNSQVYLAPPSVLAGNSGTYTNYTSGSTSYNPLNQTDTVNFSNTSLVPNNYPQVSNSIPTTIFPQQNTTTQVTTNNQLPVTNNTTTGTQNTTTGTQQTTLKPISMTEAQWAVKFEEKVMKEGYKPTQQEMAKYQDIVARYKANPKVDSSILEILAGQSSSLGAQVASMKFGKAVAEGLRGLRPGSSVPVTPTPVTNPATGTVTTAEASSTIGGVGASLKGIGMSLLKGSGLSAIVSGGFSLITNGIQVFQGKKTWSDVGGTVAADTANGAVSGLTGTLGAGVASLVIGGATGFLPTLVVGLGAMGGAWLGDKLFRGTGLYDKIKEKVSGLFAKDTGTVSNQYQNAQTVNPNITSNTQQNFNVASTYQNAQVYTPS